MVGIKQSNLEHVRLGTYTIKWQWNDNLGETHVEISWNPPRQSIYALLNDKVHP